jgi:tRNA(fMet)-specific endonuclease VapC
MPATHLLDTSVYSQRLKPKPHVHAISRWDALGDAQVVTSAICEAEVLFGICRRGSVRLAIAFASRLRPRLPILPLDSACATAYADLRLACERKGCPVADMDLLIAATAKAKGLILATLNVRHFNVIPGISVEDWSQPQPS